MVFEYKREADNLFKYEKTGNYSFESVSFSFRPATRPGWRSLLPGQMSVRRGGVRSMIYSSYTTRLCLLGVIGLCFLLGTVVSATQVSDSHGMTYFPADHVWNVPVNDLPVKSIGTYWIQNMTSYSINKCGGTGWCKGLEDHAWVYDEIPINWVDSSTPHVPVAFRANGPPYGNSDWIDAPVTATSKVQTDNGDRRMIIVDTDEHKVYEFFQMINSGGNSWSCTGEFVWDLNGYRIQPNDVLHPPYGLASVNAAGVPEIAGLVRYDEVQAGVVDHAVGGVIVQINYSVSWPGSHKPPENNQAWSRSGEFPDYSQRMRLKDSVDISSFGPEAKVVATALKKYGVIITDRGSLGVSFNVEQDSRFSSLGDLHTLSLSDFEFVDESSLMINSSTAQVRTSSPPVVTPVAMFTGNVMSGTPPTTVQFTDTSTNSPTSWAWTFGDGATSTLKNPSHTYTTAGVYTVSLTVTNSGGSTTRSMTNYITVTASMPTPSPTSTPTPTPTLTPTPAPTPPQISSNFVADNALIIVPTTVQFTDTSTGVPTAWSWDLGDGGKSTLKNPSHTYTTAGRYTVTLTVTNSGGSSIRSMPNYINAIVPKPTPTPSPDPAPASSIKVTTPNGGERLKLGTSQTISWNYTGNPGSAVKIVLLKGGKEVGTIKDIWATGSNGKGSCTWPVSSSVPIGSDFTVSVQSINQTIIKDLSDNYFTITTARKKYNSQ